jgi:hypothetical protein
MSSRGCLRLTRSAEQRNPQVGNPEIRIVWWIGHRCRGLEARVQAQGTAGMVKLRPGGRAL